MKKIFILFPKDSEALFNLDSKETFGGASVQLYNIARALHGNPQCQAISLISTPEKINFADDKLFDLRFTGKNKSGFLHKAHRFHSLVSKEKPDFILQRGLTLFSCLLALYCALRGINFIFMFAHDREAAGRYQKNNKLCPLFFLLTTFSKTLVVQNSYQKEEIFHKSNKVVQLASGYKISRKKNSESHNSILWVGRIEPWKQPEYFLQLAKDFPETQFTMIAPLFHREIEYGNKIQETARTHNNLKLLSFVPYSKISTYFNEAFIFVNTSEKEGFPNTFVQAAVASLPILSLNVNPDNFLTTQGCGFFCCGSYDLLKESLSKLLNDKSLYRSMSENAYRYVAKNHDIEKLVQSLCKKVFI